jgi:hypothetical protein
MSNAGASDSVPSSITEVQGESPALQGGEDVKVAVTRDGRRVSDGDKAGWQGLMFRA